MNYNRFWRAVLMIGAVIQIHTAPDAEYEWTANCIASHVARFIGYAVAVGLAYMALGDSNGDRH